MELLAGVPLLSLALDVYLSALLCAVAVHCASLIRPSGPFNTHHITQVNPGFILLHHGVFRDKMWLICKLTTPRIRDAL